MSKYLGLISGSKTGGVAGDLDAISHTALTDDHWVMIEEANSLEVFRYSTTDTSSADSDHVIPTSNGTGTGCWVKKGSPIDSAVPTGGSIEWPTSTPPAGFLERDGSAISRTTYAALFAVISDDYGPGDGVNTFNIPDSRGVFSRGWDHGAGNDPDAASRTDRGDGTTGDNIGTKQAEGYQSHSHVQKGGSYPAYTPGGASNFNGTTAGASWTNTGSSGGNETRPVNVNVMWVIKY